MEYTRSKIINESHNNNPLIKSGENLLTDLKETVQKEIFCLIFVTQKIIFFMYEYYAMVWFFFFCKTCDRTVFQKILIKIFIEIFKFIYESKPCKTI